MDTSISGDRYVAYLAYLAYIHHSGALGRFFEEFRRKKKKRIHMPVHIKTIPNDFLMILQQTDGGIWLKVCVFAK